MLGAFLFNLAVLLYNITVFLITGNTVNLYWIPLNLVATLFCSWVWYTERLENPPKHPKKPRN